LLLALTNHHLWVSRNTTPAAPAPNTAISCMLLLLLLIQCKSEMHENCNVFLFLIEINNMIEITAPDTFYQYPGPVFGAGAVFRSIDHLWIMSNSCNRVISVYNGPQRASISRSISTRCLDKGTDIDRPVAYN